jgi:AraC-like DNA-binding protein
MNFRYIKSANTNQLVQSFYELNVAETSIPLSSKIIPTAQSHIIFVDSEEGIETNFKSITYKNLGLIVLGQSYKSYTLKAIKPYFNFGISFHPTALYKLLKTDISKFTDKHIDLSKVESPLYSLLNPIFKENLKGEALASKIESQLAKLDIYESKNTLLVDEVIKVIYDREGIINVEELLKIFPISQKNLEIQFKKIIGLTPLKFIKLYKFLCLMRQYESNKATISQLVDYYAYYDFSHFSKDFKLFMNLKPADYFKTENKFLSNYLKE